MTALFTVKSTVTENIRLMKEIKNQIEKLQRTYDSLRTRMIEELGHDQSVQDSDGNLLATLSTQTKTVFNSKLFGAEHPRLYKKFTHEIEYPVLRLK